MSWLRAADDETTSLNLGVDTGKGIQFILDKQQKTGQVC